MCGFNCVIEETNEELDLISNDVNKVFGQKRWTFHESGKCENWSYGAEVQLLF